MLLAPIPNQLPPADDLANRKEADNLRRDDPGLGQLGARDVTGAGGEGARGGGDGGGEGGDGCGGCVPEREQGGEGLFDGFELARGVLVVGGE